MKKLYLLTTVGLGSHYVFAEDAAKAQTTLESALDKAAYGFSKDREVTEIKILASELEIKYEKPWFTGKETKILTP